MRIVALRENHLVAEQIAQCRRLAQVLTMTKEMLVYADNGQWNLVAERESERRADLEACFSDAIPAADAELAAQAMAALLHLNEELMAKLKVARSEVMNLAQQHTRKQKALDSYQETLDVGS